MLSAKDVVKAHKVLKGVVAETPLDYDHYLSEKYGAKIYLKKENAQRVRSFKIRGAYYAISQLTKEERERGVVCASAGNHAQGVAYTCNEMKIPATIFMPITTPQQKIGQVRFFGGDFVTIKLVGDTFDASAKAAQDYTVAENRTFIDPFDDPYVQAGQGTVAYEILEEARKESIDFDTVLVPVGGGGLIAGVSTYIKETNPAIEVLGVEADILAYLAPGMILSVLYVIFFVARSMGKKERARLGIQELTEEELNELTTISDPEVLEKRRPQNFVINAILTIVLIGWLVAGSFINSIEVKPVVLFLVGTGLALMINYPDLKAQSKRIGDNAGDAVQVVLLVFGAGVFMGLFQGTGMATALTDSIVQIIPKQLAGFWSLIIALISIPGTFFLTNDGFYYGVLIPFAEVGRQYGFTDMQMALASLMGQAFHLLSPLVAFIYLLLRLTGLDMGEWQKESAKYAAVIFVIFVVTIVLMGHMPLYLPQ